MAMTALPANRNIGPILLGLTASLDVFAVLLTILRIWVRYRHNRIGWDDWMIIIAVSIANSRMIFQILQSLQGNGRHRVYLSDENYILSAKWGWYAQLGLFAGICCTKISICLLILRVADTKLLKRVLYGVMVGLVLTNGTFIIILLAECSPVKAYWRDDKSCWTPEPRVYTAYIAVGYGVVADLVLSLLPVYIMWRLPLSQDKKLLVSGLMALGLVATGFGIARAASLGISDNDLTWDYCIVAIWSNLELFLAIIAANLALGRSIFFYFREKQAQEPQSNNRFLPASSIPSFAQRQSTKRTIFEITIDGVQEQPRTSGHDRPQNRHDQRAVWFDGQRANACGSAAASEIPLEQSHAMTLESHVDLSEFGDSIGRLSHAREEV